MTVGHFFDQLVTHPIDRIGRIAVAFIPRQRPDAVARRDDDLQIFSGFEFPGRNAPADRADLNRQKMGSASMFEPVIAGEQIDFAVGIDVRRRHSFGVEELALIAAFARPAGEHGNAGPWLCVARVSRNVREGNCFCALVPESELGSARVFEITECLIVVLRRAALFDQMPFPGDHRREIRIGVFPPPDFRALPVAAEHKVRIAIAVDVVNRSSSLDGEKILVDDVAVPAFVRAPVPDERGRDLAETEHEIIHAVPVQIGDERAGLLGGLAGCGQLSVLAREMAPFRLHGGK